MSDVVYTSKVHIDKLEGSHRLAWVEPFDEPLEFGVHSEVAEFYERPTARPLRTTLDHVVAAAGG